MILKTMTTRLALAMLLVCTVGIGMAADSVDFSLADLNGKVHKLSDYRGKWVVVNYWATWCPPCLEEIPELETFHEGHKDKDAVVLGVALDSVSREKLLAFVNDQFMSYPVFPDKPRRSTPLGPIPGMPTTYVVSPEGEVVAWQVGGITREILERFLVKQQEKRNAATGGGQ